MQVYFHILKTNAGLKACVAGNFVTEGPININNSGRVISANNKLTTSGWVNITGSSVVTYGGGALLLTTVFWQRQTVAAM